MKSLSKHFLISLLLSYFYVSAEAQNILWQKCLGGSDLDYSYTSLPIPEGGYLLGGFTYSGNGNVSGFHGGSDAWVQRLDDSGILLWQKCIGGSGMEDGWSVCQATDQGYVFAGYSNSEDGDLTVNHGYYDVMVMKLDTSGDISWLKSYGGTGLDRAISVIPSSDNGYLVIGYTESADGNVTGNHGGVDVWILKLDQGGNLEWQKCLGGSGDDYGHAGIQTGDNGYLITGTTESDDGDVSGNHGSKDFWVVKLDAEGNITWQKCFGGSNDDAATCIEQLTGSGFLAAGYTMSSDGDVSGNHGFLDMWVVKMNTAGNLMWQECLGGTGEEMARDIQITSEGNYLISGYATSNNGDVNGCHGGQDAWLLELDPQGNLDWQKCYGGSQNEDGRTIQLTPDGGYFLGGYTFSDNGDVSGNHGYSDSWAVKLAGTLPDPVFTPSEKISVSPVQFTISSNPGVTLFYTLNGSDPDCNSSLSGISPLVLTTPDSCGTFVYKAIACMDGWNPSGITTAIYHVVPVETAEHATASPEILVYPNPVTGNLYLDLKQLSEASAKLFDTSGRMLIEQKGINETAMISTLTIPAGMYILTVTGKSRAYGTQVTYSTKLHIK